MIFVSVGSSAYAFDRLLIAVAPLAQVDELLVQRGVSRVSVAEADVVDYLDAATFDASVREARIVIGHAGVGVAGATVAAGRPLIVVPRLVRHGEAVDDHQVVFGNALSARGLATCLHDPTWIPAFLEGSAHRPPAPRRVGRPLVDELKAALGVALHVSETPSRSSSPPLSAAEPET